MTATVETMPSGDRAEVLADAWRHLHKNVRLGRVDVAREWFDLIQAMTPDGPEGPPTDTCP